MKRKILRLFLFCFSFVLCFLFGVKSYNLVKKELNQENKEEQVAQLVFRNKVDSYQKPTQYSWGSSGGSYYLSVLGENITDVSALSVDVFYEPEAVNVATISNLLSLDSTSIFDSKIDNTNGVIHISYAFLENQEINDMDVFSFDFRILDSAKANSYFSLAIVSACDEEGNNVEIQSDFSYFTIKDSAIIDSIASIYVNSDKDSVKQNEIVTLPYQLYDDLGAGTFELTYDRDAFELLKFQKGSILDKSTMYTAINTSVAGKLSISFASMDTDPEYFDKDLFSIQFKVKTNSDKEWDFTLDSSGLTSKDGLTKYKAPSLVKKIQTVYEQDTSLLPLMYLSADVDETNKKVDVTLSLEANSHLSAADIEIDFDTTLFSYESYQSKVSLTDDYLLGVNDKKKAEGVLKLSWVFMNDLTQKVDFAKFTFDILDVYVDSTPTFALKATGTRDQNLKTVDLAYQSASVSLTINKHEWSDWSVTTSPTCTEDGIESRSCNYCHRVELRKVEKYGHDFVRKETPATCTEDGKIEYICSRCGEHDTSREETIPAKGHSYKEWITDTEPTCNADGERHRTCSECGQIDTDVLSVLGHDYVRTETPSTCTEDGKIEYICSRCGEHDTSREETIPAKGHSYGDWITDCEPFCMSYGVRHQVCLVCGGSHYEEINPLGHYFVRSETDVTCTNDGKIEYICSRCGEHDTSREETIPAKGHSYGEWITDTEPTCTADGERHRTCSECGQRDNDIISALGHDLVSHDGKNPTCTDVGWNPYETCTRCGYTTYVEIPVLGHDYLIDQTNATCTQDGKIEYICSRCGEHDTSREEILPAKGHSYGEWITDTEPTCTSDGLRHHLCSVCGQVDNDIIFALGHDYVSFPEKEPTCTEEGTVAYVCSRCGDSYVSETEIIPALGHDYVRIKTDATCIEDGKIEYVCSRCGDHDSAMEEIIHAKGHSYGEWIVDSETTCLSEGRKHRTCSDCADTQEESIPALGHDYKMQETPATCTEEGKIEYICSRCGEHDTSREEILPAKGHSYGEWITDTEPTCTSDGLRHRVCSACGNAESVDLSSLGHEFVRTETGATCTEEGKIEYVCSRCGEHDTSREETIPAKGHSYGEWITDTEPTCTADGERHRTCSECGQNDTDVLSALGHDYVRKETPSTCTEDGKIEYICSKCGDSDRSRESTISATGHSYGDWIVDSEASCTLEGHRHRTCSACGNIEEETSAALGHDLVSHDGKEPTCTEIGWNSYETCSRCGYTTYSEIPALGHDYVSFPEKEPTCTEEGTVIYICSRCGDSYASETETIPLLGHDYVRTETDATCTADGRIEYICSRCGEYDASREETIPAKGHSYGEWITDTEPTCTADGERHHTCSECGHTDTDIISALGHDLVSHDGKDPTCTEAGWNPYETCSRCGYTTYVEIPALGHDYIKTETLATCTEDGKIEYICSRCGEHDTSREETIPAKGHSYGGWITEKEATTKEEGLMSRTCSVCGDVETKIIPKLEKKANILAIALPAAGVIIAGISIFIVLLLKKRKKQSK